MSELVNSDTCPRPTTKGKPAEYELDWAVTMRTDTLRRLPRGSVALSLCTTAHPRDTTNVFGASISEATMRLNPRLSRPPPKGAAAAMAERREEAQVCTARWAAPHPLLFILANCSTCMGQQA